MTPSIVDRSLTGAGLLAAAAAEVTSWPFISPSRARQVKWVSGEYTRALAHPEHPLDDGASVEEVFTCGPVDVYLCLARTGRLRVRQAADPSRGSGNSEQIRLEVLGLLVTACGAEGTADLPPQPDPPSKRPVTKRPRALLRAQLTELADAPAATTSQLRMLAAGAVVSDTGIRAGGMCACTTEDLSPTLEELRVVRRPQGWSESQAYTELVALSGLSRASLKRWLPERHQLLTRVAGTMTALWVSLHSNHHDGQAVPAGNPPHAPGPGPRLDPGGRRDEHRDGWTAVLGALAHAHGAAAPGLAPKAVAAPMQPDAEKAAALLDEVDARARALAELRRMGEDGSTAELQARIAVRQAVRDAWAEGVEHTVQLTVLAEAGLTDSIALAAAGWEPVLLAAIDRSSGWGRPSKATAAV
ncbi:hypothetical protein [Streptomyces lavendulae]|uniref:hypothetical protein n=1 Tax=Streptomyces lavendulae TaxID=1914 RepID=UPI0024A342F8|nr:hypothetical protein [Streptomyces lavendulae]GLW04173.1 hypothetical protein Slala05_78030 [Streptomyces lavendulae subsp. lavendulae]